MRRRLFSAGLDSVTIIRANHFKYACRQMVVIFTADVFGGASSPFHLNLKSRQS